MLENAVPSEERGDDGGGGVELSTDVQGPKRPPPRTNLAGASQEGRWGRRVQRGRGHDRRSSGGGCERSRRRLARKRGRDIRRSHVHITGGRLRDGWDGVGGRMALTS